MTLSFHARPTALAAVALSLTLCGCSETEAEAPGVFREDARLMAIGDSIFAFHRESGGSIPEVAADALGLEISNLAVSGAQLTQGEDRIPDQLRDGDWEVLIMDGGGNDLNDQCGCGECGAVLDRIIGEEGQSGVLPEFIDGVTAMGKSVVFVGYYEIPEDADFGFDRCIDDFEPYRTRLIRMADARDRVTFVDSSKAITADMRDAYDPDRVHPSAEGAQIVGTFLAEEIGGLLE